MHELQLMFGEAVGFSGQGRYQIHPMKTQVDQIHPMKTQVVSLTGLNGENDSWLMGKNKLTLSDSTVHLGLIRAGKKGISTKY